VFRGHKKVDGRKVNILAVFYVWASTALMDLPFTSGTLNQALDDRALPFANPAKGCFAR
jgi:hypothetical protein